MGMRSVLRRLARAVGSGALWALSILGICCAGLWLANACGFVQPLIVTSGSMSPHIAAGDLILATPTPASEVAVGEVATLPSSLEDTLVTHRVTSSTPTGDTITFEMKGDANDTADPETYAVAADADVWQPRIVLPGAGRWIMSLLQPQVALPLLGGVLALIALALLPSRGRDDDPAAGGEDGPGGEDEYARCAEQASSRRAPATVTARAGDPLAAR